MFALVCNTFQSPTTYSTLAQAKAAARYYSRQFGKTVKVTQILCVWEAPVIEEPVIEEETTTEYWEDVKEYCDSLKGKALDRECKHYGIKGYSRLTAQEKRFALYSHII